MPDIAIHLRNLSFSYPRAPQPTIECEDLQIFKGEKIFIYGPSGSGKTTLLEILSGVLIPQRGEVQIGEVFLNRLPPAQRDHFRAEAMSFIFQNFNLLPYLNVRENIELPLQFRDLSPTSSSPEKRAHQLQHFADYLGISEFLTKAVHELSVGQQQRVAVARALMGRPQILLADEPTSSLDYDNREKFLKILFELAQETQTTVLFVSHDRTLEALFDRSLSILNFQSKTKNGGQK